MSTVKPVPEGMHTVMPHLVCDGASDAIAYYKRAFGAVEISRMPGPSGRLMNAQLRIGDSVIMLVDEAPEWKSFGPISLGGSPVTIHLYVEDVDTTYKNAVAAGGTGRMEPAEMFWGDRYGQITDPFGHIWSMATHTRDMTPEQMQKEFEEMSARMGGECK
jgi:PhnB protein